MARTLAQIDLAVSALESELPKLRAGLMETLRQNTLALESEYQTLLGQVGLPANNQGSPTGFFATFAAINVTLDTIQNQLADLSTQLGTNQTSEAADAQTIANINLSLTNLDNAISGLQAQVTALQAAQPA